MNRYICSLFFLILFVSLVACRDESSDLGGKWLESKFRNVVIDTCTVRMSTLLMDSVNTSSEGVAFVGKYSDDNWGQLSAVSYIEYNYQTFVPDENIIYRFDSVTLRVLPIGEYLGDTLQLCRFRLHRLKETIKLNNGYLYNTSSLLYDESPFSTVAMHIHPKEGYAVEARLPDDFGLEWFNAILEKNTVLDSQDNFRNSFPGIVFTSNEDYNSNLMGFSVSDSSFCIKFYYRQIAETSVEKVLSFTPSSTKHFVQTKCDRSGTLLNQVVGNKVETLSSETGNKVYLQGMTGLYTKIEFPYLNNLQEEGELVTIESARLYLYPVKGTYGGMVSLPDSLSLYTSDENNMNIEEVTDVLGTSIQHGNLVVDELLHQNTYYSFDITSFMQSNLGAIGINRKNLQLVIPESKINTSFQSVLLGDMEHPESPVKLSLLIKIYNK